MKIPDIQFKSKIPELSGIEIFELEQLYQRQSTLSHDPSAPHRVEFNCLLYITSGIAEHFIDFNHYSVTTNNFIFIQKHQVQAFDFANRPQGLVILFTDEFFADIQTKIRLPAIKPNNLTSLYNPVVSVKNQLKSSCESLLNEIIIEQKSKASDGLLMQLIFSALFIKVMKEIPQSQSKNLSESRSHKFNDFIRLIEDRSITSREANDYANLLNMTYKSLNQICKLASNKTAKQLIDLETILEAKRKLAVENIQVQALAYELGFDEVTNFVKYFKRHTALTPSQFKDSLK
jgi:AraC family transcriptional regulator, transcriptional activator of pobA